MSNLFTRALMTALFAVGITGCNQSSTNAPAMAATTPEGAVKASVQYLKTGNIAALIEHALPTTDFAAFKANWNKDFNAEPATDEERQKFSEMLTKLTAADAEAKLFSELEPQLKAFDLQYQQQMPVMVSMGRGYLQGLIQQNKDLSEPQKQQALSSINALADWVEKTRFTDPELVKKALTVICNTAREMNLKTLDEARAFTYEQAMQKAQVAFLGTKKLFDVYGFSIDQALDSVKTEVLSNDGNLAKVKIDYTLLGMPLNAEAEMVKVDNQWYGKDTLDHMKKTDVAVTTEAPAEASAPVEAPSNP